MRTRSFLARWLFGVTISTVSVLAASLLVAGSSSGTGSAALTSAAAAPEMPDITVAAIPAVDLAGQIDISAGSYVAYLAAQAAGARFRIPAEASTLSPDTRALVVTANSRITTVGQLTGRKFGVNGVNSIGTLLVGALLSAHGISPDAVRFVTDPDGFPAMAGTLQHGAWDAAFLAEPYITAAGQQYGQLVLADLDQGAVLNLPVDGYVATQAWARVQQRHLRGAIHPDPPRQPATRGDRIDGDALVDRSTNP